MKLTEIDIKSHSRNPLIFGLFNRMDMVEQVGSGIGRITRELQKLGLAKPVYKTDGLFTVVFTRTSSNIYETKLGAKLGVKLGENEQKIFDFIQKDPSATIVKMAEQIRISRTSIENNINKLKNKKIITRVGSDKNGHWEILDIFPIS